MTRDEARAVWTQAGLKTGMLTEADAIRKAGAL